MKMDVQQQIERYQNNDRIYADLYRKLKADDPYKAKGFTQTIFFTQETIINLLGKSAFSGLIEQDYPRHEQLEVPIFYQSWHHSFPQELMDQFKR
jgi:hypothetical protein